MFKKFKPDMDVKSVYDIDFDDLYNEGIKGIIFDIDNTLVAHDAPCNDQSDELVKSLIEKGFKLFILSNNDEDRVKLFIQNFWKRIALFAGILAFYTITVYWIIKPILINYAIIQL